jgi:flagellar basal-body rod protein FlgF
MLGNIYQLASQMSLETQRQELIARNLAGSGLAGYKAQQMAAGDFALLLAQASGATTADGTQPGTVSDFSQGALKITGRTLDFAINGPGFFQVTTPEQTKLLTRNGAFHLAADGTLVTLEGYPVAAAGGEPLRFNPEDGLDRLTVRADGSLVIRSDAGERQIGKLALVTVPSPERLDRVTASYFRAPAGLRLEAAKDAAVTNGALEGANFAPVREMASMIQSLREFEMGHQMLRLQIELAKDEQQKLIA